MREATNTDPIATPTPIASKPKKRTPLWLKVVGTVLVGYVGLIAVVSIVGPMAYFSSPEGQAALAAQAAETPAEREARRAAREARDAPAMSMEQREQQWVQVTKQAVRRSLRDPGSAEFRNVALYRPFPGRTTPVVCGEVNADNGFSGRSGFQGWIGSGDQFGPFLEEQMAPGEWGVISREMCVNATPVAASAS